MAEIKYPEWKNGILPIFEVGKNEQGLVVEESGGVSATIRPQAIAPVLEFRRIEILNERLPVLSEAIGVHVWQKWEKEQIKKLEDAGATEIVILRRIMPVYYGRPMQDFPSMQAYLLKTENILVMEHQEVFAQSCFFGKGPKLAS